MDRDPVAVRRRSVAHVLTVDRGWPPVGRAAGTEGPGGCRFFPADPELSVLRAAGPPFLAPPWHPGARSAILDAEGLTRLNCAPRATPSGRPRSPADRVGRPPQRPV